MIQVLYTVQSRDRQRGLTDIARCFYGDPNRWLEIYEMNRGVIGDDPTILRPGQHLMIPNISPHTPAPASVYTVQPADDAEGLPGIARRFYGDASRWGEIYELNRGAIGDDPHAIQAGQRLVLILDGGAREREQARAVVRPAFR